MIRGTTPTYIFKPRDQSLDLTRASKIFVTFSDLNDKEIYTKTGADLSVSEHSVSVYLSQEETLMLSKKVKIQLNWLYSEGPLTKRASSNIFLIDTERNLLDEVLE